MNPCPSSSSKVSNAERKKIEQHCKEVCLRYSAPALFGNWYENQFESQIRCSQLEIRLAKGETYLQRKDIVLEYLFTPGEIAKYNDYLLYDNAIQLITDLQFSILPDKPGRQNEEKPIINLTLSTLITDKQIDEGILSLSEGCILIGTENKARLRKNIFCFVSADPIKAGGPICYDDVVYLRLWDSGTSRILYVTCEIPHIDAFGMDNQRFLITFTEQPDRYSKFRIINCIEKGPNVRLLTRGHKITSNTRIIVNHILSNRCLAVESNEFINTLTMGKERLVSCFNYQDIYRQFTSENYWIPITRKLGEDARQMDEVEETTIKNAKEAHDLKIKMEERRVLRRKQRYEE